MKKNVVVKFDPDAYEEYLELQKNVSDGKKAKTRPTYKQLLVSIDATIANLKINPFFGNCIPRKYLTKAIMEKYGTDKIFRVELVGYWRLLYTVIGNEVDIIAFVLEFMDHERYNKMFAYRKI
jgi:hypothetical protein